jgi:hypothetical protein
VLAARAIRCHVQLKLSALLKDEIMAGNPQEGTSEEMSAMSRTR